MCCLFGIIDRYHFFSRRQRESLISVLAKECEVRGTDATGIAYNSGGKLRIYKKAVPAHAMHFRFPEDAAVIMGHTRMSTQGSEKKNYNNHPFRGLAGETEFALAHNGVLYNDKSLRHKQKIPHTHIETDSYIAVQLLEQRNTLDLLGLQYMAEQVKGSFTFTLLDRNDNLYFVKGNNPLCVYYFPRSNFYLYASTEEILSKTLLSFRLVLEKPVKLSINSGNILVLDANGQQTLGVFNDSHLYTCYPHYPTSWLTQQIRPKGVHDDTYLTDLKAVAVAFGVSPPEIDYWLMMGFTPEEIEELLYSSDLFRR